MKKLVCAVLSLLAAGLSSRLAWGVEPVWNYAVQLSAVVQSAPPQITLSWPQDSTATPNNYTVYRKAPGASSWGSGTTLPGSATSFVDSGVAVGIAYEFAVVKNAGTYNGYGYLQSAINLPLVDSRGKVVLVVESTYAGNLSAELTRLQQDLAGDGWTVLRHDVGRNDSIGSVKNLIKADYNADPAKVKAVFLFGHVPVPYSGQLNPDGHADHVGAWPADVYYGEMDGNWTDSSVNFQQTVNTDPADAARLSNVPGDGKFDQTTIPSGVELQVGRVDLANMPGRLVWGGPASFPGEQELLRQYLNKDHNFRHKLLNVPRRGLVADYFGVRNGEAFGASGYRGFAPLFGANNIANLNVIYNDQKGKWVPELGANAYLWAYGSGAGSYLTIAGLGNTGLYNDASTTEVVNNNVRAVFALLFGSWNGDWDHEDNFLRAILATKDYGLTAAWSGRPHWFVHPMGLGETIGYCARLTQNNTGLYQNQINNAANLIHIALMGDPTLRLHPVAPPGNVGGTASAGSATLSWTPSADSVAGYNVYRATSANGPFTRLTGSLLTTTSFLDSSAPSGAIYMVRAVILENTPSGSYYNPSQGLFWTAGGPPSPSGDTTPPTVSLSAPANGATVFGSAVTVSANASDNIGVLGVQFKLDGSNLGAEDLVAPHSVNWDTTGAANGSHTLTAVARDLAGNQTTATAVSVTVSNAASIPITDLPTVTLTSSDSTATEGPTDTASFTLTRTGSTASGLTVTLAPTGTATKWDDYRRPVQGDMPDTWIIPAGASSLTITVIAVDDTAVEGTETATLTIQSSPNYTVGTPNSVTLTLLDNDGGTPPPTDSTAPTISLSAPANNAAVSGSSVTVSANAADNVGVTGVQFKLDGADLGDEDTSAPYSVNWNTTSYTEGTHVLTAVARDAAGNRTTSAAISVTLSASVPSTSTLPSWVGAVGHNWTPRLGGVYWLNSRAILKQVAPYFSEYPKPVLVDIKSNASGFGYRFDLDSWDSWEETHSWFLWNGTDQGTPASPEDAFNIFGATGNAEFILNIPIPRTLTANPSGDGFGYTWQTAQFYAAMMQYLFGSAGPQAEWQSLPSTLDFFAQPASFNWANLRARRGHVNAYPVVAVIIGEEPYNLEGLPDGASYGAQAEQFRLAIRNRGVNLPLGLHVRDMGLVDDPDAAKWFWPMMNNLTESDFSFIDLEHYYQFSTVSEDYKRTYPVSINPSGFQGWWLPQSSWKSDYTRNLWIIEDTRHALRDFGGAGVGDPNRWQLGFSEHGIQISSQFLYNDMFSALHWAGWLAEAMRQNTAWDSGWTLLGEGFATAALQVRNGYVTRTPMFYVYQMAQEFYGYDYLDNNYASAMGSTTDNLGRAVQFPWTVVRVFRDASTGNIHLFVFNQSTTESTTLSGFETWNVVSWKQLKGASYSDSNLLGVAGPETIQAQALTLPVAGAPLAIAPISVNHIVLAASNNSPSPDLTPPTLAITSPANGTTVSGAAVTVSANATDNVGVVGVQFKLDGANLGAEDPVAPYNMTWNTTTIADGSHTLSAVARDSAGNQSTATPLTILVSNSAPVTLPTITVAVSDANASRVGPDNGAFTITRTGSTASALTVNHSLGGAAVNGTDYNTVSTSVTIPAGAASATLTIVPKPATSYVGSKTVTLTLATNAAYNVGSPNNATFTMAGNAVPIKSIKATRTYVTITWTSAPGKTYRVAYRNSLSDATWTDLSGSLTATSTTTTWIDDTANRSTQRYYVVYVVN